MLQLNSSPSRLSKVPMTPTSTALVRRLYPERFPHLWVGIPPSLFKVSNFLPGWIFTECQSIPVPAMPKSSCKQCSSIPGALWGALRRIKRHHLLTLARNVLSYSYSKRYLGSYPITCHALHFIWPRTWQQTWLLASQSKTTFSATPARVLIWGDLNVGARRREEKNEWTVPPTEYKHLV